MVIHKTSINSEAKIFLLSVGDVEEEILETYFWRNMKNISKEVEPAIRETSEFAHLCSLSEVVMKKDIV